MYVTFLYGTLDFCKDFILCGIDEVHVIMKVTFFETHMVDVRRKSVCLWCNCEVS